MKKREKLFMLSLLFTVLMLSFLSLYSSFLLYQKTSEFGISARASTDSGQLNLIVESAPPTTPTPAPAPTPATGGAGGGGRISQSNLKFEINPNNLDINLIIGEIKPYEINVKNTGNLAALISVDITGINKYLLFNKDSFFLEKGKEENYSFTVNSNELGVFPGKIIFKSGNIVKTVFVILNFISKDVLFDVSIIIPDSYKKIKEGENIKSFIELVPIGRGDIIEVTLKYIIKDFDGNLIFSDSENLTITELKNFDKEFLTFNLKPGNYIVGIELTYLGGFASSSSRFEIISLDKLDYNLAIGLLILIISIIIVYYAVRYYKNKKRKIKINKLRKKSRKK